MSSWWSRLHPVKGATGPKVFHHEIASMASRDSIHCSDVFFGGKMVVSGSPKRFLVPLKGGIGGI